MRGKTQGLLTMLMSRNSLGGFFWSQGETLPCWTVTVWHRWPENVWPPTLKCSKCYCCSSAGVALHPLSLPLACHPWKKVMEGFSDWEDDLPSPLDMSPQAKQKLPITFPTKILISQTERCLLPDKSCCSSWSWLRAAQWHETASQDNHRCISYLRGIWYQRHTLLYEDSSLDLLTYQVLAEYGMSMPLLFYLVHLSALSLDCYCPYLSRMLMHQNIFVLSRCHFRCW